MNRLFTIHRRWKEIRSNGEAVSGQRVAISKIKKLAANLYPLTACKVLLALALAIVIYALPAQAATGIYKPISYQGKISLTSGTAIGNGSYNMRFKIFAASSGGNPLWTETWDNNTSRVTMTGGLFSVQLGSKVTMTGSVDFNSDSLFLQVEFDPGNDGVYEEIFAPRRQFTAVPYALNAANLNGLDSTKFVRKDQAETMSGTLTIKPNSLSNIGLNIISTASSNTVPGLKISTQGANHILFGTGGTTYDTNLYRQAAHRLRTDDSLWVGTTLSGAGLTIMNGNSSFLGNLSIGTSTAASVALEVIGTASGRVLHAQDVIESSGSLVIRKMAGTSTGNILVVDTKGLVYDGTNRRVGIGTASPKTALEVLGTASGISLHASTDLTSSGTLSIDGNTKFKNTVTLKKLSGTSTGNILVVDTNGLIYDATNKRVGIGTASPKTALEVLGTASGNSLHASSDLTSSGTLSIQGNARFKSTMTINGVTYTFPSADGSASGKVLATNGAGQLSWTAAAAGGGITQGAADSRYVNAAGDTMSGALVVKIGSNGAITADAGIAMEIIGTASGQVFHAQDQLQSSGSLVIRKMAGTSTGNILVVDTKGLVYDGTNRRVGIGTATPDATLEVLGTSSGTSLHASNDLTSSGSLSIQNNTLLKGTLTLKKLSGTSTGNILIVDTVGLVYDATNKRIGIGTATPDATLEVLGTSSGNSIHASNDLTSSGSLSIQNNTLLKGTLSLKKLSGTSTGNILIVDSTGLVYDATNKRVGIGTATPSNALHLKVNNASAAMTFEVATSASVSTTAGPTFPGTGADDATVGTVTWSTPSAITASDDSRATATGLQNTTSHYLKATNFGFNIPSTATINGITVEWEHSMAGGGSQVIKDNAVRIVQGGTIGTTDKSSVSTWPTSDAFASYGSAADLWGLTWAASDINATTFGAALSAKETANFPGSAQVDSVRITVAYTTSASSTSTTWTAGEDSSDSKFKLSYGSTIGTNAFLVLTGSGKVGVGKVSSPGSVLSVSGAVIIGNNLGTASADAGVGLEVIGTASGRILNATDALNSSGTLVVKKRAGTATGTILAIDSKGLVYDATNKRVGIGTASPKTALDVLGTSSVTSLHASSDLTSSGTLSIQGNARFKSTMTINGVTYTFPSADGSASGKVLATNGAGLLSWTATAGITQAAADSRYVNAAGDTMSGALVVKIGSNGAITADAGLAMEIIGTASGQVFHAQDRLESSGSLVISGKNLTNPLVRLTNSGADSAIQFQTRGNTPNGGPLSGGTFADDATLGTVAWTNPANAGASDNVYATATAMSNVNTNSHYLKATNFGFNLPGSAIIKGITVEWEQSLSASFHIKDNASRIVKGGVIGSTDKSKSIDWTTTDTYISYGSTADLWGLTWTAADINSSGFGAALAAVCSSCTAGTRNAQLDHVRITVTYSAGGTSGNANWIMGSDVSDSAMFKLSGSSSVLGTNDFITVNGSGGSVAVGNGTGQTVTITSQNLPGGSFVVERGALCVDNGGSNCSASARTRGNIYAKSTSITAIDLAENYPTKDQSIGTGQVLALDPLNPVFVKRASGSGNEILLGISSTQPGLLLGGFNPEQFGAYTQVPVALAGRVPVKINGLGGHIAVGDLLTASAVAGIARKALPGEQSIGYALEPFTKEGLETGTIQVFMRLGPGGNGSQGAAQTIDVHTATGSQTALKIVSDVGSPDNTVFRVNASGAVFSDSTFNSNGADYAEWFKVSGSGAKAGSDSRQNMSRLQAGEVVCIDVTKDNTVARCTRSADPNVMGIVSSTPAFIGNTVFGADQLPRGEMQRLGYVLVGLIGQVPAKTIVESGGIIRPGDSLTSAARPGYVRKAAAGESTVGVALEGLTQGEGVIKVLISRRNQSLTVESVEQHTLEAIKGMAIQDDVRKMIGSEIDNLHLDETVHAAVERQISNVNLEALIGEIINRRFGTGTMVRPSAPTVGRMSSGTLTVNSIVSEKTLLVGGDARIGGDLTLDGVLKAKDLLVPGILKVDGAMEVGELTAKTLHAGSGSDIRGTLRVDGDLVLGTGSLRLASGSILRAGDLIVGRALLILGDITVKGLATFLKDVHVEGVLSLSTQQQGTATMLKGERTLHVAYPQPFAAVPGLTITPKGIPSSLWGVTQESADGFSIALASTASGDIRFSWLAIPVTVPSSSGSSTSSSSSETSSSSSVTSSQASNTGSTLSFPVDDKGVPLSSDLIWNACIRHQAMTDPTGRVYNCSRYVTDHQWEQPDLHVSFSWNDQLTPPLLALPEGYRAVTASAATSPEPVGGASSSAASSQGEASSEGVASSASSTATMSGASSPELVGASSSTPAVSSSVSSVGSSETSVSGPVSGKSSSAASSQGKTSSEGVASSASSTASVSSESESTAQ